MTSTAAQANIEEPSAPIYAYSPAGRRDPFTPIIIKEEKKTLAGAKAPLERYPINEFKLVGVGLDRTTKLNGRHPYLVRWSFRVGGQEYHGQISHMNESLVRPLAEQTQLAVLYLPDDPKVNTVWVP